METLDFCILHSNPVVSPDTFPGKGRFIPLPVRAVGGRAEKTTPTASEVLQWVRVPRYVSSKNRRWHFSRELPEKCQKAKSVKD